MEIVESICMYLIINKDHQGAFQTSAEPYDPSYGVLTLCQMTADTLDDAPRDHAESQTDNR